MLKKLLVVVVGLIASIGMALAAVNINTATEAELDSLPGVGPAKAKAIVEYRKANGNFKSLEDIKNVKGIGDKTYEDLKSQISLSGATTVPAAAPPKPSKDGANDKKAEKKEAVKEEAKPAKAEKPAKADKAEKPAKADKADKADKAEKSSSSSSKKSKKDKKADADDSKSKK